MAGKIFFIIMTLPFSNSEEIRWVKASWLFIATISVSLAAE